MAKNCYPRWRRIARRREIVRILETGNRAQCERFVAVYRRNGKDHDRCAFLVGRRHGNAVERNRTKRVLREVVRLNTTSRAPFHDLLILPNRAVRATYGRDAEVYREWRRSLSS